MTTAVRPRSPNAEASGEHTSKKAKLSEKASKSGTSIQIPSDEVVSEQRKRYDGAEPYKYAAISGLLSDELLESVVEESRTYGIRGEEGSLQGWGWEQKETDIYKIQQTPDLSSLDPEHLPDETLAALPNLTRLKDALYSAEFRNYVRRVTGCDPISGKKTDCSVGLYIQGSHLLLHDDSISTRRVSYILYLPNSPPEAPSSSKLTPSGNGKFLKGWDPAWGGALELFPVENDQDVGPPANSSTVKEDVKWGQIVFFEVQPGRSYHAVQEVVVGDGRQRLGVSGWFHRPIEGEEGYEPFDKEKAQQDLSSLAQITSIPTAPFTPYENDPPAGLKPSHLTFLAKYLAPSYLTTETLEKLSGQFVAASEIVLHNFLKPDLAAQLKKETQTADERDYPPPGELVPQKCGEGDGWNIHGPTSKHRYLNLTGSSTSTPILQSLNKELLPSEAFRAWLSVVSSLAPVGYKIEARRFRRGLDYTLANGEECTGEARLDVWLGTTWWADVPAGSDEEDELVEHGGWECYLAAPDEDEDPETFQSALAKKAIQESEPEAEVVHAPGPSAASNGNDKNGDSSNGQEKEKKAGNGVSITMGGTELEFDPDQFSPSDFDSDSEAGSEDDGPLLTQPISFNKLLLVLRDPGVMRFVKYLSAGAKGSRWDVGGEFEVGVLQEDEDTEEAEQPDTNGDA